MRTSRGVVPSSTDRIGGVRPLTPLPPVNRARTRKGWPATRRKSPGSTASSTPGGRACSQAVAAIRPSGVDPRATTATSTARARNPRTAAPRNRAGATTRAGSIPRRRSAASASTSSRKPVAGPDAASAAALATRSSSWGHRSSTNRATRSSEGGRRNGQSTRAPKARAARNAAPATTSNGTSGGARSSSTAMTRSRPMQAPTATRATACSHRAASQRRRTRVKAVRSSAPCPSAMAPILSPVPSPGNRPAAATGRGFSPLPVLDVCVRDAATGPPTRPGGDGPLPEIAAAPSRGRAAAADKRPTNPAGASAPPAAGGAVLQRSLPAGQGVRPASSPSATSTRASPTRR